MREIGQPATSAGSREATSPLRALVVDDSRAQRVLMSLSLMRWGYEVCEAASGEEALLLCTDQAFDIILSDWMMGRMSGPEFCRKFRQLNLETYAYFILLTSKSEAVEITRGLEAGADDFLTKPVNPGELRARVLAGERIIAMQRELVDKNQLLARTLQELQQTHTRIDRDLIEARKLQQALLRDRYQDWEGGTARLFLRPSGPVGGDLAGFFEIDATRIGLFSIDVAGHGVTSALMTARLAAYLSGGAADQNIALYRQVDGQTDAWPPEEVAHRLNRLMIEDLQVDQYFTMAYAEVNLVDGSIDLVQAGHPHPLILRASGEIERIGHGGLPVGLLSEARYERVSDRLAPGDRLFLLSDGLSECPDHMGQELGEPGLIALIQQSRHLASGALLDALLWDLAAHLGSEDFPDDVSGLLFDYRGKAAGILHRDLTGDLTPEFND